ncbi:hypothetical protein [Streptomyces sp. NPDC094032]|uniref:hypothetical protein n=1 Tax=Streptomyces sp. NPDC094032 TaxID=3155308 RepID=UPI00332C510E
MAAERTRSGSQDATHIPDRLAREMDRDELSRMVREANDSGASYQDMADRAAGAGHSISKPYMQKIATNNVASSPSEDRLEAIAAAIGKPIALVKRAAAIQWLGYDATELSGYDDDVRIIVAHLAGMEPKDRKKWLAMIEAAEKADTEGDR